VCRGENGELLGVFAAARDITQQKRTEDELRNHRDNLEKLVAQRTFEISRADTLKESIISTIPSAVVVLRKNYEIVTVNERFFEIFSVRRRDVSGMNFFEIIRSKQYGFSVAFNGIFSGEQESVSFEDEFEFIESKTSKILRFYVSRIASGEQQVFLAIEDVTRAKALELQIMQSERLAATGRLTASIAHEINNPLQGMLTHLELLRGGLETDPAKLKNYEFVKSNLLKISEIVGQLLDVYRSSGKQKEYVNINDLMHQVVLLIDNKVRIQGVALVLELDPALPPLLGLQQQLHQVFLNILLNALESIEGAGTITVVTSSRDGVVQIAIKDTGRGMNKESMKYVFDLFYSTKKKTGLGLFICQGFIKNHNGMITVESQEGHGSVFTITIPLEGST
jgi:PAS domain S-box-containing protein